MSKFVFAGTIAAAVLTMSVSACSGASAPQANKSQTAAPAAATASTSATPSASTTPTPSATPSPTATAAALQDSWTDDKGYKYSVDLVQSGPAVAEIDTADAQPGQAIVKLKATFTGSLVNTTAGHNAPFPKSIVTPLWGAGSAICGLDETQMKNIHYPSGYADEKHPVCTAHSTAGGWVMSTAQTTELTPGTEEAVTASVDNEVFVPEGKAQAFKAAFEKPLAYALARETRSGEKADCAAQEQGYSALYVTSISAATPCTLP